MSPARQELDDYVCIPTQNIYFCLRMTTLPIPKIPEHDEPLLANEQNLQNEIDSESELEPSLDEEDIRGHSPSLSPEPEINQDLLNVIWRTRMKSMTPISKILELRNSLSGLYLWLHLMMANLMNPPSM